MTERWRAIPDFPGYEVSDHGQVRSYFLRKPPGAISDQPQRILAGGLSGRYRNYRIVCLYHNGRAKSHHIHRLVAEAFLGPCPDGLEVCHNDSNPLNNRADNLRYDTRRANTQDMIDQPGYRPGACKLTDEQVIEMRTLRSQGSYKEDLAERFGVHPRTVSLICAGKGYPDVGGPRVLHGTHRGWKLDSDLARQLRHDRNEKGMSLLRVAAKYGVSISVVSRVAHGLLWSEGA